jgi:nucleoside phosphorylase
MTTPPRPLDLGIVVALPDELRELLALAGTYTPHHDDDLDAYLFARGPYRCAATLVGDMGEAQAARVTERLIALLDPGSIVVVGVTGGVHDDLRVGDVHVPPQAVQYIQDAKAAPTSAGGFAIVPGAPAYRADYALLAAVRSFEFSHEAAYQRWLGDGRADLATLLPAAARDRLFKKNLVRPDVRLLADGHVATGPVVGAAAAFSAWIRSHDRNVKSLEMESAAVLLAAQNRHAPRRALAIRAISDLGDHRKQALDQLGGGALRQYAMRNAVRLLFALLDAGAWPRESTAFPKSTAPSVSIGRLPVTDRNLFGRKEELAWLDTCWAEGVYVASIIAWGGVGKSALVNAWLARMRDARWRGAEKVFGWSFYSQGTDRLSSSDEFIEVALRWFGDVDPKVGSPWDKGERLAALVRKQRTLLVLDGVEPLQWGPGVEQGKLKDPALQALVKDLGAQNLGLCLITTRIHMTDLEALTGGKVQAHGLDHLSAEAGAELLKARGARGSDEELEAAAKEYDGHSFALTLLGTYIRNAQKGDIRKRDLIPPLEGKPAHRMMATYERWFQNMPELAILRMLGLFDRPVPEDEIAVLRAAPVIPGLTDALAGLSQGAWNEAVTALRDVELLAGSDMEEAERLDAHPLVREYFGEQLKRTRSKAWREGHRRLYEHLQEKAKLLPDTIEEMAPLYAAVVHGCLAGLNREAELEVHQKRIRRGNEYFSITKLGAFGSEVAVLSAFFDPPWERLAPGLSEGDGPLS